MPRDAPGNLLLSAFAEPRGVARLSVPQWDQLIRLARAEQVLARLGAYLRQHGVDESLYPERVADLFQGARAYPNLIAARAHWELHQVLAATRHLGVELVLLKGAAYLEAGLPLAEARTFADLDLLVPREQLAAVEQALLARGWEHQQLHPYDQRYYREWMHEIPPLRHAQRFIEVDLHHRLLPQTSRLNPRPELVLAGARPVRSRVRVPAPTDLLLHSATHLFYDGDIAGRFRELLDLHLLFEQFGPIEGFWAALPGRARELELERPLFYAVRCCAALLETPFPAKFRAAVARRGAPVLTRTVLVWAMRRVLLPRRPGIRRPRFSAWLLYVRSHWLRMRPRLLANHLIRKAWRRMTGTLAPPAGGT